MLEIIRKDLKKKYPPDICDSLVNSYLELKEQYYKGKYEPAELNGGKFVEACLRLIQYELTAKNDPIGVHIPNIPKVLSEFENCDKTKNESFRILIPRALITIYNIRNKRGVGHLGGAINPNFADSTLIVTIVDWVLAELYRIVYTVSLDEAQNIVNDLVRQKILLIQEIGYVKRVLDPSLSIRDQTLLLLFSSSPKFMTDKELIACLEYGNSSYFRNNYLKGLHQARLIEYFNDGRCTLLPPGFRYVEDNYSKWVNKINGGA